MPLARPRPSRNEAHASRQLSYSRACVCDTKTGLIKSKPRGPASPRFPDRWSGGGAAPSACRTPRSADPPTNPAPRPRLGAGRLASRPAPARVRIPDRSNQLQVSGTNEANCHPRGKPARTPRDPTGIRRSRCRLTVRQDKRHGDLQPRWARRGRNFQGILRKEVIQPQVPLRLPCYDLVPITGFIFGACLAAPATSDTPRFGGLTGGVYKAQEHIHRGMLIRDY